MTTESTTTTIQAIQTKLPNTVIDENAQQTINIILWAASGTALLILVIRLLVSGVRHCRRSPVNRNRSSCTLEEAPPPSYSQLTIRSLPPTYSQACRIIHYHPSTGNTSQQTNASTQSAFSNLADAPPNQSFDNDFTAPPSASFNSNENASNNTISSYRNRPSLRPEDHSRTENASRNRLHGTDPSLASEQSDDAINHTPKSNRNMNCVTGPKVTWEEGEECIGAETLL